MDAVTTAKLYTRKELVTIETSNVGFHTNFYIPAIQKLAFHLPPVRIIGTKHFGNTCREEFKRHRSKQDLLCCCYYAEILVAIFHTKYSLNTMAEKDLCILKALRWSTCVHQHIQKQQEHHKHAHVMLCFIHFCLMTENRILPQLLYTANISLNC